MVTPCPRASGLTTTQTWRRASGSNPEASSSKNRTRGAGGEAQAARPPPPRPSPRRAIPRFLPLALARTGEAVDPGVQAEILVDGQVRIEREVLRHVANRALDLAGLRAHVIARDQAAPAAGWQSTGEHLDLRR